VSALLANWYDEEVEVMKFNEEAIVRWIYQRLALETI